ncbi:hypothetical protein D3C78_19900 [compost metagenome]
MDALLEKLQEKRREYQILLVQFDQTNCAFIDEVIQRLNIVENELNIIRQELDKVLDTTKPLA